MNKVCPQSPVPKHAVSHMLRITYPKGTVGVIVHMLKVPHLLEKGGMPHS